MVKNCESYNEQFDTTFVKFVASLINSKSNKRRKIKHKVIPIACNNLWQIVQYFTASINTYFCILIVTNFVNYI